MTAASDEAVIAFARERMAAGDSLNAALCHARGHAFPIGYVRLRRIWKRLRFPVEKKYRG